MTSALCYCIHDTLDSGEEMSIAGDNPGPLEATTNEAVNTEDRSRAGGGGGADARMCKSHGGSPTPQPPLIFLQDKSNQPVTPRKAESPPLPKRGKKKKKKSSSRSHSSEGSSTSSSCCPAGGPPPPLPPTKHPPLQQPPPTISVNNAPTNSSQNQMPPPPMIVQILPPTPTTPTKQITPAVTILGGGSGASSSCSNNNTTLPQDQPGTPSVKRKPPVPTGLNLPQIYLPAETDPADDQPDHQPQHQSQVQSQCEIRIEYDHSNDCGGSSGANLEEPPPTPSMEGGGGKRGRPRRRSLVAMLFLPKSQASETAATPTLEAPQGQRLHFRRVSEIFSRMSGKEGSDADSDAHDDLIKLHRGGNDEGDHKNNDDDDDDTPASPPESCGLSIRNLFPYRRRRSSVTYLDNTDQFKESREEIIQNTRRRMSSFPPMDGDEAAIMLEKANVIRLEAAHQEALALQSGNSLTNAFRRLRRGSRSPSPMSLFPGVSKAKKTKWKSTCDISSREDKGSGGGHHHHHQPLIPSSLAAETPPTSRKELTVTIPPPSGVFNTNCASQSPPTVVASSTPPTSLSLTSSIQMPTFPDVPTPSDPEFGCLPPPLSPLRIGPNIIASSSLDQNNQHQPLGYSASAGIQEGPKRPHFVFPKRRLEDVPGIFIPKTASKPVRTKTTEDVADTMSDKTSKNLLAVMRDRPRRHSMSDPIFLQTYAASHPQKPLLLPRSPYSHDSGGGGALSLPRWVKHATPPADS